MSPFHPTTLAMIVADFQTAAPLREEERNAWRAEACTFDVARDEIARARLRGRRHPHQYRRSEATLKVCERALRECTPLLLAAGDFDGLYAVVWVAFEQIPDVGPLTIYDAADRLGLRLGHAPTRIHLHAGTREGARKLLGRLPRGVQWLEPADLPAELSELTARELEDLLCIFKNHLNDTPEAYLAWRASEGGRGCDAAAFACVQVARSRERQPCAPIVSQGSIC